MYRLLYPSAGIVDIALAGGLANLTDLVSSDPVIKWTGMSLA